MGSRDKDTKSLHDKLKLYFKKGASAPLPSRDELVVSAELERALGPDAPPPRRLRVLRDTAERLLTTRLQQGGAERLWSCVRDLLSDGVGTEGRAAALALVTSLAGPPHEGALLLRTVLLRWLRDQLAPAAPGPPDPADEMHRFQLLHRLTNGGKDITCLEDQMGPFLLQWISLIPLESPLLLEFLQLLTNVVKFNATYLDEDIVHGIVNSACHVCSWGGAGGVAAALALLEAVLGYSLLPRAALPQLCAALCRTVNVEQHCQASWHVVRCAAGSDLGYAALQELVALLRREGTAPRPDAGLLRGAVFYVHAALWGARRVPNLHVSHLAVLCALRHALRPGAPAVLHEVLQAVLALLARRPHELHEPAWDALIELLHEAVRQAAPAAGGPQHELLLQALDALERLQDDGQYSGDEDALLGLLDAAAGARPEPAALRLVTALAAAARPDRPDWLARAAALQERYVRREPRAAVRAHALQQLHALALRTRALHEDELLERALLPACWAGAADPETAVRAAAARVAADLALHAAGDGALELLDVLQKVLDRPFEVYATESSARVAADADPADVRLALAGLADVFRGKLLRAPAAHAARAFLAVLEHVERQYRQAARPHHPDVRAAALRVLLALRVGAAGGARLAGDGAASPHLLVSPGAGAGPGALPLARVLRAAAAAVLRERCWGVLEGVLSQLLGLVVARGAARRPDAELDALAGALCSLAGERAADTLAGQRVSQAELLAAVLPVLAALAPAHAQLEPHTQQRAVRSLLKYGIVLRQPSSQQCISALTLFTLEAQDTMVKMLPQVLLDLSKISDTKAIACPMLEFLSTLTRLPRVFASFVEDQYMSVFAILLPYTNPSRYCHYAVSLAHHVVAAWFLKCRRPYRRNFVPFIIHGLHNYIIIPFEEQLFKQAPAQNEDSSNRKRSSSLGSRGAGAGAGAGGGSRAPLGPRGAAGGGGGGGAAAAGASAAFHLELTETCVDLLARHAHAGAGGGGGGGGGAGGAAALLAGGPTATWLVGHKLVSVTTSGCHQLPLRDGICDRCAAVCREHAERVAAPLPPLPPDDDSATQDAGAGGAMSRQNSSETRSDSATDNLLRDLEEDGRCWRVGALAAARGCGCVCAGWAELRVRSPTGDARWLLRLQGDGGGGGEEPQHALQLLAAAHLPPDLKHLLTTADWEPRARSSSAAAPRAAPAHAATAAQDLYKSSSDTLVTGGSGGGGGGGAAGRALTSPINIPGSPQRQSSSSTTDDDDATLQLTDGKARLPVRRSNSSPEMSSSWKLPFLQDEPCPPPPLPPLPPADAPSAAMSLHASKKAAKKPDTRVSCEAIPEEMSGTSPLAPPPLPLPAPPAASAPAPADAPAPAAAPARDDRPHHALQKVSSAGNTAGAGEELPPLARSKRSNTISVMSPTRRRRDPPPPRAAAPPPPAPAASLAPAFLLLQLYHNMPSAAQPPPAGLSPAPLRPLRVAGVQHERTIKSLDLVPPVETYKVGVLYVGPGQADNEVLILRNQHGSARYGQFLSGLGSLVELADAAPELFLNQEAGGDGTYTYVWHDDVMQVQFHVATAMPANPKDPNCNEKRKYIGNDHVSVVYNDSGQDFSIHTIKGQLNLCIVVVEPRPHGISRVSIRSKDERVRSVFLPHLEPQHVSDAAVPLLARQVALHAALASHISQSLNMSGGGALPYASNALERLRVIKRLRARLLDEREEAARAAPYAPRGDVARRVLMDDFTEYT